MIYVHMDLLCDGQDCFKRYHLTDLDHEDRNSLEDLARMKGWSCIEGIHLCPECADQKQKETNRYE